MNWLISYLSDLIKLKFTGKIEINFFDGGIASVRKLETIELPK
jgi:hypothetical protein